MKPELPLSCPNCHVPMERNRAYPLLNIPGWASITCNRCGCRTDYFIIVPGKEYTPEMRRAIWEIDDGTLSRMKDIAKGFSEGAEYWRKLFHRERCFTNSCCNGSDSVIFLKILEKGGTVTKETINDAVKRTHDIDALINRVMFDDDGKLPGISNLKQQTKAILDLKEALEDTKQHDVNAFVVRMHEIPEFVKKWSDIKETGAGYLDTIVDFIEDMMDKQKHLEKENANLKRRIREPEEFEEDLATIEKINDAGEKAKKNEDESGK